MERRSVRFLNRLPSDLRVRFNFSSQRQRRGERIRTEKNRPGAQLRLAHLEFLPRHDVAVTVRASSLSSTRPPFHHQNDGHERGGRLSSTQGTTNSPGNATLKIQIPFTTACGALTRGQFNWVIHNISDSAESYEYAPRCFKNARRRPIPLFSSNPLG